MIKRVVGSPKFEAKQLFDSIDYGDLFEYFFEDASPPDNISKEDYLKELEKEFCELKREEARRLLGLEQRKIIYYYYEFPDGQVFEGRLTVGSLEQRDRIHRNDPASPVYKYLKRFPDTKIKKMTKNNNYKTENIFYLYDKEKYGLK